MRMNTEVSPLHNPTGPLRGTRVVEIGSSIAVSYAAKILGDLDADVIKIEPPRSGDPSRHRRNPGESAIGESAEFTYFNTSKRSVEIDVAHSSAQSILLGLLEHADVLLLAGKTDETIGGLSMTALRARLPRLIIACVSAFGSSGPYSGFRGNHLALAALGCWADTCGVEGREPLQPGGAMADTVTGAYGVVAVLGALELRERTDAGELIDVSGHEAAVTCTMLHPMRWEYWQEAEGRHSDYMTGPSFFVKCSDGFIGVNILTEAQWELLCAFIGRGEFLADERFETNEGRMSNLDFIRAAVQEALGEKTAAEAFHEAQEWRLPFGLVPSPSEVLNLEPHIARAYFVEHEQTDGTLLRTPRVPFRMGASPSMPTPPPKLGNANDEVMRDVLGLDDSAIAGLKAEGVVG